MEHKFIQHLKKDHEEQRKLGEDLRKAKKEEVREKLRKEFYKTVPPHMDGEDASIFKFMASKEGKAKEQALNAMQEHHVGKLVLRELMDLNIHSDVFNSKTYVLDELNRHHMEEEEEEHFSLLTELADDKKLDELFEIYKSAEEKSKSNQD